MGIRIITRPNTSGDWCIAQSIYATKASHATARTPHAPSSPLFVLAFIARSLPSLRHLVQLKIMLRGHPKRISHAIEKRKHRRDVNGLGNLRLGPSVVAKRLHIFGRGAIRGFP